jgi:hypothetical protein
MSQLKVEFSDKNNKFQYDSSAARIKLSSLKDVSTSKLYLGDRDAGSMVQLKWRKIDRVINCQIDMHGLSQEKEYKYLNIDPLEIEGSLSKACKFIEKGIKANENILIFCQTGYGRSAAVFIYFLMKNQSMTFADAHRHLESFRKGIDSSDPTTGFRLQLVQLLIAEEKSLHGGKKKPSVSIDEFRVMKYMDGKRAAIMNHGHPGGGGCCGDDGGPPRKNPNSMAGYIGLAVVIGVFAVLYFVLEYVILAGGNTSSRPKAYSHGRR